MKTVHNPLFQVFVFLKNKSQGRNHTSDCTYIPVSGIYSCKRRTQRVGGYLALSCDLWGELGCKQLVLLCILCLAGSLIKCNYSFYQGGQSLHFGNSVCLNLIHLSNIYLREFSLYSQA